MIGVADGPSSALFKPLALRGNVRLAKLADVGVSERMAAQRLQLAQYDLVVEAL